MNNIVIGPNSRVAISAASFLSMGLNATNTTIIYQAEGAYKSWKPGRLINAITATESQKGYIIISKQALDLSQYFAPPLVDGFSFEYVFADDEGNLDV